jgi:mannose-6-phosphate isomerase-like protein (cupin superfamily)
MKLFRPKLRSEWKVFRGTRRSQAAEMVIPPGGKEGGPGNRHRADQWLLVLSGAGEARLNRRKVPLPQGALLLIEAGETHEIRNTGRAPLKTLNFYSPPAFGPDDE